MERSESQINIDLYTSYINVDDDLSGTQFVVKDDQITIYQDLDDEDEPDKFIVFRNEVTPSEWADFVQLIQPFI